MKKGLIVFGILLVISIIGFLYFRNTEKEVKIDTEDSDYIYINAEKESRNIKEEEKKPFIEINMNNYLDKYQENERVVFFIGRDSCQYCQIVIPILQKISKEKDIDIYYLNTDSFTEEDKETLQNSNEYFSSSFKVPLLFITKKEEILDKTNGILDTDHYLKFLKDNSII